MGEFFQEGPRLANQWDDDAALRGVLARRLPTEVYQEGESELHTLGARVTGEIARLGDQAEARPPELVQFDAWGRRVDQIRVDDSWTRLQHIAAEAGLVAIPYDDEAEPWSRLEQLARIHLFHPSSAIATCPLAMTDGAAKLLRLHGPDAVRERVLPHLTSRDPERFWTSGQWMTERAGGSDVARTATVARPNGDHYRLFGVKWFTSAATSEVALTLARIEGDPEGSRGLSVFYLETRDDCGALDGMRILRLKDKLGTRALPTAELELDGTPATLIGERGRGVATIATLLNITRLWNAASAVAGMRRGLALARDYAGRREAFGKRLMAHPLHRATLADLQAEYEAALQLVAACFSLLGQDETGVASAEAREILRLLTPLAKLWTGKMAVAHASEALESFGGAGYIEDTGLPRLLRDAQVLAIWEGTTNVLALDVLRALRDGTSMGILVGDLGRRLDDVAKHAALREPAVAASSVLADLERWHDETRDDRDLLEAGARDFALRLAAAAAAVCLLEQAVWDDEHGNGERSAAAAHRFVLRHLQLAHHEPAPDLAAEGILAEGQ
jgi:putative acyl-CoA dehydrogenase